MKVRQYFREKIKLGDCIMVPITFYFLLEKESAATQLGLEIWSRAPSDLDPTPDSDRLGDDGPSP